MKSTRSSASVIIDRIPIITLWSKHQSIPTNLFTKLSYRIKSKPRLTQTLIICHNPKLCSLAHYTVHIQGGILHCIYASLHGRIGKIVANISHHRVRTCACILVCGQCKTCHTCLTDWRNVACCTVRQTFLAYSLSFGIAGLARTFVTISDKNNESNVRNTCSVGQRKLSCGWNERYLKFWLMWGRIKPIEHDKVAIRSFRFGRNCPNRHCARPWRRKGDFIPINNGLLRIVIEIVRINKHNIHSHSLDPNICPWYLNVECRRSCSIYYLYQQFDIRSGQSIVRNPKSRYWYSGRVCRGQVRVNDRLDDWGWGH